jgi:microsomal dipeptidase-like Zn-dependent dipeptidase
VLAAALVRAGLSTADVRKIFAENALRVLCGGR